MTNSELFTPLSPEADDWLSAAPTDVLSELQNPAGRAVFMHYASAELLTRTGIWDAPLTPPERGPVTERRGA